MADIKTQASFVWLIAETVRGAELALRALVLTFFFILTALPVVAMEFTQIDWRGKTALLATGEIVAGDATRFKDELKNTPFAPHGVPIVLLDSPGGSVSEALAMSEILDSNPAHTVIPSGAKCASACASILFIAGTFRTMETSAAFGQHSCSVSGIPVQSCNDDLAKHAVRHGVAYGAVAAFVTYVPPEEIVWFNREDVDCWGISRYPFSEESGYETSDPCAFKLYSGNMPASQSAWRIDFSGNGYMAFLRPAHDHLRELQLDLWCDENKSGNLFLSMEIQGPAEAITDTIDSVNLYAEPVILRDANYRVEQIDETYSRATIEIQKSDVMPFLTETNSLTFWISTHPPYQPIVANTYLSNSREVLLFAANNCLNK